MRKKRTGAEENEIIEERIRSSQRTDWKDKTPYKDGIARRLRLKSKKKAGKKATK